MNALTVEEKNDNSPTVVQELEGELRLVDVDAQLGLDTNGSRECAIKGRAIEAQVSMQGASISDGEVDQTALRNDDIDGVAAGLEQESQNFEDGVKVDPLVGSPVNASIPDVDGASARKSLSRPFIRSDRETANLHEMLLTPLNEPHPAPSGVLSLGGICGSVLWLTLILVMSTTNGFVFAYYAPVLFALLILTLVIVTAWFKLHMLCEFLLGMLKPAVHAIDFMDSFGGRWAPRMHTTVACLYRGTGRHAQSFEHSKKAMSAGPLACCDES